MIDYSPIVHVSFSSPFMDNSTYQETILANNHKEQYKDVYIVTTNLCFDSNGLIQLIEHGEYTNNRGVNIIRIRTHRRPDRSRGNVIGLYKTLCKIKPNFIMDHGLCITSGLAISLYKIKNKECKVVADSHMTKANYSTGLKSRVYCFLQRLVGKVYYEFCDKIYGITSQTVGLLIEHLGVPRDKTERLLLGYDEKYIDLSPKKHERFVTGKV